MIAVEPLYDIIEDNGTVFKGRLDHFLASWSPKKKGSPQRFNST